MECLELTNTTDQAIDLNQEYELAYRVQEGSYKALPIYQYAANEDPTSASARRKTAPFLPTAPWFSGATAQGTD